MTSRPVAIDEQGTADLKVDSRQVGTTDGVPNVRQIVAIGAGDSPNNIIDTTGGTLPVSGTVAVTGTQSDALTDAELRAAALPVTDANTPDLTGTWAYKAGTSGTPTIPAGGRVVGITAVPATGGGSLTIDGGDAITIPEDFPLSWQPLAQLVAPALVFTDTQSYVVEYLT